LGSEVKRKIEDEDWIRKKEEEEELTRKGKGTLRDGMDGSGGGGGGEGGGEEEGGNCLSN
jgi:hypothetical protein